MYDSMMNVCGMVMYTKSSYVSGAQQTCKLIGNARHSEAANDGINNIGSNDGELVTLVTRITKHYKAQFRMVE